MKICIIGLGYIGLPTAAVLSNAGHKIIGVDLNKKIISKINQGAPHFEEDGLDELLSLGVQNGNIIAQEKPEFADVYLDPISLVNLLEIKFIFDVSIPFANKKSNKLLQTFDMIVVLDSLKGDILYSPSDTKPSIEKALL